MTTDSPCRVFSTLIFLLIKIATTPSTKTNAFQIIQPAIRTVYGKTRLQAFSSFHSTGSFWVTSDDTIGVAGDVTAAAAAAAVTPTEPAIAIAAASDTAEAFTDQIDFLGDPTIRTLFLVFGGFLLVLAGLSVLSQTVDSAIEGVIVDFESVLKTDPEFRSRWKDIQSQLEEYDDGMLLADDDENKTAVLLKRKQKLFEIMEELQETEPALMKRINSKMEALKK